MVTFRKPYRLVSSFECLGLRNQHACYASIVKYIKKKTPKNNQTSEFRNISEQIAYEFIFVLPKHYGFSYVMSVEVILQLSPPKHQWRILMRGEITQYPFYVVRFIHKFWTSFSPIEICLIDRKNFYNGWFFTYIA